MATGDSELLDNGPPIKSLRDPVYGYVYLTPIEQPLVDLPEFQRLRYVLQQSTAHLTFPSNTTTRFAHSLGASHLAGQMFLSSIYNADNADQSSFLKDASWMIRRANSGNIYSDGGDGELQRAVAIDAGKFIGSAFAGRPIPPFHSNALVPDGSVHEDDEFDRLTVVRILWQSVRLATLVHDLGHLPMSHLMEDAFEIYENNPRNAYSPSLKDSLESKFLERIKLQNLVCTEPLYLKGSRDDGNGYIDLPPPHEMAGSLLFQSKYVGPMPGHNDADKITQIVTKIAKSIVVAPSPTQLAKRHKEPTRADLCVSFLHHIIAGELDCDRLDYCVRDPGASGSCSGDINVEQIVRGSQLVKLPCQIAQHSQPSINSDSSQSAARYYYRLGFDRRSLPDIEQFFVQRYHGFREVVGHHYTARSAAYFKHAFCDLVTVAMNPPNSSIRSLVAKSGFLDDDVLGILSMKSTKFCDYDDYWLRSFMISMLRELDGKPAANTKIDKEWPEGLRSRTLLIRMLKAVLYRNIDDNVSVIKCDADAYYMLTHAHNVIKNKLSKPSPEIKKFVEDFSINNDIKKKAKERKADFEECCKEVVTQLFHDPGELGQDFAEYATSAMSSESSSDSECIHIVEPIKLPKSRLINYTNPGNAPEAVSPSLTAQPGPLILSRRRGETSRAVPAYALSAELRSLAETKGRIPRLQLAVIGEWVVEHFGSARQQNEIQEIFGTWIADWSMRHVGQPDMIRPSSLDKPSATASLIESNNLASMININVEWIQGKGVEAWPLS